jgi:GNAT superfamily N-acetyltransferase
MRCWPKASSRSWPFRKRANDPARANSLRSRLILVRRKMPIKLEIAGTNDAPDIVGLRAAVAGKLTAQYGPGPWSGVSTERGVLFDMRNSRVLVARRKGRLVATLRLTAKKPWAIDRNYFSVCRRPLYLLSMAVAPDWQRQGIGRWCVEEIREIGRRWPADVIRLDAYDAPAGAGPFYKKCGFKDVGRASYRGCPLAYFEMLL